MFDHLNELRQQQDSGVEAATLYDGLIAEETSYQCEYQQAKDEICRLQFSVAGKFKSCEDTLSAGFKRSKTFNNLPIFPI